MPARGKTKQAPNTPCYLPNSCSSDKKDVSEECTVDYLNNIFFLAELKRREATSSYDQIEECPMELLCAESESDDFELLDEDPKQNSSENVLNDFRKCFLLQHTPTNIGVFSLVSDEIILHIFKFLPRWVLLNCALVCKRWRRISYDESLWREYDLGQRTIQSEVLEAAFSRGVVALRIAMSEIKCPVFSPGFLTQPKLAALQYLDLSMATVPPEGLAEILYVCTNLKKLSLESCVVNDYCLKNISKNPELSVLNLAMCKGITVSGLRAIFMKCIKLTELNLAWIKLNHNDWLSILPFIPKSILRLNVSGQREYFNDECLLKVVNRCLNLVELDISDCLYITHKSFEVLIRNCRNLEHLHSSRSYCIPTDCNRLLKTLPKFKYLDCFKTINDEALESLRDYLPHVLINQNIFSTIARPTTGLHRTSIWGIRTRDGWNCSLRKNSNTHYDWIS